MSRTSQKEVTPRRIGWPAAATIIAATIGAVATSIALAMTPYVSTDSERINHLATNREIGEIKTRLEGVEMASRQLREELKDDMKELREMIQMMLKVKR